MSKAITIGCFDGVHMGHRYLLQQLRELAAARGLHTMAVTFRQHPALTLGRQAPAQLCSLEEKVERLRHEVETVKILDFTEEMSHLTACEFMRYLRDEFGARLLLVGYDHRFGRPQPGEDIKAYKRYGQELGLEVVQAERTEGEMAAASSTNVRRALAEGNVAQAALLLGRPYSFSGVVVRGHQVGRTLGFPTANIQSEQLIPCAGVYAVRVSGLSEEAELSDHSERPDLPALLNIGHRPTLQNGEDLSVEVHIPGFSGDLYGQELRIEIIRRLRNEQRFASLEELRHQISLDLEAL